MTPSILQKQTNQTREFTGVHNMCHVIKFISLTKLSPDLIKAFLSGATSNCIAFQAEDFGFVFIIVHQSCQNKSRNSFITYKKLYLLHKIHLLTRSCTTFLASGSLFSNYGFCIIMSKIPSSSVNTSVPSVFKICVHNHLQFALLAFASTFNSSLDWFATTHKKKLLEVYKNTGMHALLAHTCIYKL